MAGSALKRVRTLEVFARDVGLAKQGRNLRHPEMGVADRTQLEIVELCNDPT